jgi:hypothetical protein
MPDIKSLEEQPGCRSMLVRLIFRPSLSWPIRRPLRLKITFTMPMPPRAAQNSYVDERKNHE